MFDLQTDQARAQQAGLQPNGFNFEGQACPNRYFRHPQAQRPLGGRPSQKQLTLLQQDAGAVNYALDRALDLWWNNRSQFHALQETGMRQDWCALVVAVLVWMIVAVLQIPDVC